MTCHVWAWKWLLPGGEKNTFQWFLFVLVMALDFSCFDMMAKMCTAFLCHPQTYFQQACFHAESEGSISLARHWVWVCTRRPSVPYTLCSALTCGRKEIWEIERWIFYGVNHPITWVVGLGAALLLFIENSPCTSIPFQLVIVRSIFTY